MVDGVHEYNGAFGIFHNLKGEILLELDNRKNPLLTLPGGGMGMGELAVDALVRETFEEAGLETFRGDYTWVGHFVLRKKYGDVFLYEAYKPIISLPHHYSDEVRSYHWYPEEEAILLTNDKIYPAQRALLQHYCNWVNKGRHGVIQDFLSPPFETMN